jgi:hypothetical protein
MGFSPLARMDLRVDDAGRRDSRKSDVSGVGIHHNAGVDAWKSQPGSRTVSANYWIANNGDLIPQVDEALRAWTSGADGYPEGSRADHRNITVEVSNSPEGVRNGTWAVSDAALKTLTALIADVYKRYELGEVKRSASSGVGVHSDWVPTACPGPYILKQLPDIIKAAEELNNEKPPAVEQALTIGEIMAFKSVGIGYRPNDKEDRLITTGLDFESGQRSEVIGSVSYCTSWYAGLTAGGLKVLTKGHYDTVLKEFDAAVKEKRAHELAVARESRAGG